MKKITLFLATCSLPLAAIAEDVWQDSFETEPKHWVAEGNAAIEVVKNDEVSEAVTEGDFALKITAPEGSEWTPILANKKLVAEIKKSNTLSFDLYVPATSLPADGWATFEIKLFGGKGDDATVTLTHQVGLNVGTDKLYAIKWNFAEEEGFNADMEWATISFVKNASGGLMNVFYIDNVRLSQE